MLFPSHGFRHNGQDGFLGDRGFPPDLCLFITHMQGVEKELPRDQNIFSYGLSGRQLSREQGPKDTPECRYPGMQSKPYYSLESTVGFVRKDGGEVTAGV